VSGGYQGEGARPDEIRGHDGWRRDNAPQKEKGFTPDYGIIARPQNRRRRVHLDIETSSRCDLKAEGLYRYAEHESTFVRVVCYAFDDEGGTIWVPLETIPAEIFVKVRLRMKQGETLLCQPHCPHELVAHIVGTREAFSQDPGGEVRAHNAAFERNVLNGPAGRRIGFPHITIEQTICTMVKAATYSLPEALGDTAKALGTYPKDEDGYKDMMYIAKPRKDGTFVAPEEEPNRFVSLYAYCMDDVYAERGVDDAVPDIPKDEQLNYEMDQRINDRGWLCDRAACEDAVELREEFKDELREMCVELTGYTPGQTGKLAEWCRDEGFFSLKDLKAETVNDAVDDPSCPAHVKRVLRIFSTYNMKAVAKFSSMLKAMGDDDVLRGMFRFNAAGTGRWSSRIVQLHNLYRPKINDQETAIEAFRQRKLSWLKALYDGQLTPDGKQPLNVMMVLGSCVRGMLIARPGKKLIFPDFAAIEARFNAWAWGEEWKLLAYRAYDRIVKDDRGNVVFDKKGEPLREGPDLYVLAYARAFGIPVEEVEKWQRQIGKVMELALGYEGVVGAFVKMAKTYGIDLAELTEMAFPTLPRDVLMEAADAWEYAIKMKRTHELPQKIWITLDALKRLWRRAHPRIVQGWKDLKAAAEMAVHNPGQIFSCADGKVMFRVKGSWLDMRLPSGRVLHYFKPRIAEDGTIRYLGVDTFTRKWGWTTSYGGKWDENFVQGGCACLLRSALRELEAEGYDPIGHVHDEPVVEVDEDFGSVEEAGRITCHRRVWCPDLPLAFDGHVGKRYRK
jgi:DNA polymerase